MCPVGFVAVEFAHGLLMKAILNPGGDLYILIIVCYVCCIVAGSVFIYSCTNHGSYYLFAITCPLISHQSLKTVTVYNAIAT